MTEAKKVYQIAAISIGEDGVWRSHFIDSDAKPVYDSGVNVMELAHRLALRLRKSKDAYLDEIAALDAKQPIEE